LDVNFALSRLLKEFIIVVQYEQFCRARPLLFPLIYTVKEAMARSKAIKAQPITEVTTGEKVFVDICGTGKVNFAVSFFRAIRRTRKARSKFACGGPGGRCVHTNRGLL
jgi:hypothetical protein